MHFFIFTAIQVSGHCVSADTDTVSVSWCCASFWCQVGQNISVALRWVKSRSVLSADVCLLYKVCQIQSLCFSTVSTRYIGSTMPWSALCSHLTVYCNVITCLSRAWRPLEVCQAFSDIHKQGKGGETGALFVGSFPGYGGSHRTGGRTVSGVHWVGQSREEDIPPTGSWGDYLLNTLTKAAWMSIILRNFEKIGLVCDVSFVQ